MSFPSLLGSQGCTAYDVVINQEFFQKCKVCVILYRVVIKPILCIIYSPVHILYS